MASVNTVAKRKASQPKTHEVAPAIRISPVQQLRRSVMANMLWESEFYEDGLSNAQRLKDEIEAVLKLENGADIVANVAYEARTNMNLRHVPLYLTVSMIEAGKTSQAARQVVSGMIHEVIQRPDELSELIALYWKDGKRPLPNQMKKGLAAAFTKFNDYQIRKYATRDGSVRLRDVLFLVHPKPLNTTQESLWKELADDTITAPDTWESQLSAGKDKKQVFTDLITKNQLGGLALLRNLRNMREARVDDVLIRGAIATMNTERILPFRFVAAATHAPHMEDSLEQAMFRNLQDVAKLPGKTILAVDNSPSMYGTQISVKSDLDRSDAACALAMLLREICERVEILAFSTNSTLVAPRRGFALRDAIKRTERNGTHIGAVVNKAQTMGFDRLIVITDEESQDEVPTTPRGRGYMLNVASSKNGVGYGAWTHVDGFSESVVNYIREFESSVLQ